MAGVSRVMYSSVGQRGNRDWLQGSLTQHPHLNRSLVCKAGRENGIHLHLDVTVLRNVSGRVRVVAGMLPARICGKASGWSKIEKLLFGKPQGEYGGCLDLENSIVCT